MARFSKFKRRMSELLIPGVSLQFSKRCLSRFERHYMTHFEFYYKGDSVFRYPDKDKPEDVSLRYDSAITSILRFIDGYFTMTHEDSFKKTAREMIEQFFGLNVNRHGRLYSPGDTHSNHFTRYRASELLQFLKICDRRTGKRSLRKLDTDDTPPVLRQIIHDRLNTKHSTVDSQDEENNDDLI